MRVFSRKQIFNRRNTLFLVTTVVTGIAWMGITRWTVSRYLTLARSSYDVFSIPSEHVQSTSYTNEPSQVSTWNEIFSMGVSGTMTIHSPQGWARVVLIDRQGMMHLVAQASYPDHVVNMSHFCYETCLTTGIAPARLEISTHDADVGISTIDVVTDQNQLKYTNAGHSLAVAHQAYTDSQARSLVSKLDASLIKDQAPWKASVTDVSLMSFNELRNTFGSWFIDSPGLQFYQSGTFPLNLAPTVDADHHLAVVGTGTFAPDKFWYDRSVADTPEFTNHTTWLLHTDASSQWGMHGYVNVVFNSNVRPKLPSICNVLTKDLPSSIASAGDSGWELSLDQKAILPGEKGRWDDELVYRPYVVKERNGETYYNQQGQMFVYYNGSGSVSGVDNDQIGLVTRSTDGVFQKHAGPVLPFGQKGGFDDADVQVGSVIYTNNRFHLWYVGNSNSNAKDFDTIGYASSTDGVTWERSKTPILSQGAGDDALDLYQPIVFYDEGLWKMVYTGHNKNDQYGIMLAVAEHPEGPWIKQSDHYVFYPGYAIFPSEVLKSNNQLTLFYYHIFNDDLPRTEFRAISEDGMRWREENALYMYNRQEIPIAQDFSYFSNKKGMEALSAIYANGGWSIVLVHYLQDQSQVWHLNPLRYIRSACDS